ncbi:MAG: hypothetical protein ACFE0Q_01015 [Anaerolineae bacterium]
MRALWEITEQILILAGIGLIAIQISFMLEFYFLAGIIASMLILSGGVLMLQFYIKKRR